MKKLYVGAGVIAALIAVLLTALPTILHGAGLHPVYAGPTVALPAIMVYLALHRSVTVSGAE